MSNQDADLFRAIDRIAELKLGANRTMFAHVLIVTLQFFKEYTTEKGVAIEDVTFDELIDEAEKMPAPPSMTEMPYACRIEREILQNQSERRIKRVLENRRIVAALRKGGLTQSEIADLMGVRRGSVQKMLARDKAVEN